MPNCFYSSSNFPAAGIVILTTFYLTLGKLDVLDYLINELGVDPVARDKSGMSCVHAATQGGQPNAIKVTLCNIPYLFDNPQLVV